MTGRLLALVAMLFVGCSAPADDPPARVVEDTWFADCMHPNDAGHAAMSELFWAAATSVAP